MRRKLRAWLVPTLVAPTATTVVLVTALELFGASGIFGIARWLVLVMLASVASLLLSVTMLLVDWLMLLVRFRFPPTGRRAWISGAVAPLPAYGLWLLLRPPLLSAPSTHALAIAGSVIGAALLVRILGSPKRGKGLRFS